MEYRVVIPDEVFGILEWQEDDLPAIGVVNQAIAGFEPKVVFGWHLSIIVDCADQAENGMPTMAEVAVLDGIGDEFDIHLKADGNALFLARITWGGTRQFLYRVYDPEVADAYLAGLIEADANVRPFEYRMERDDDWALAEPYLRPWAGGSPSSPGGEV